jgi:hypothetical protein
MILCCTLCIVNDIGNFIFGFAEATVYGFCKSRKQKFVMLFTICITQISGGFCDFVTLRLAVSFQKGESGLFREEFLSGQHGLLLLFEMCISEVLAVLPGGTAILGKEAFVKIFAVGETATQADVKK